MRLDDIGELVRVALVSLVRRPVRTGLTILGLTIGVSMLIAMMAFGEGARRAVLAQFAGLGVDIVRLQALTAESVASGRGVQPLSHDDVRVLRRDLHDAVRVVPDVRSRATFASSQAIFGSWIHGTTPGYFPLHRWSFFLGGPFDESDELQRAKVCVLGTTPARMLFGLESPLGKTVNVNDRFVCVVVGVLAEKGLSTGGRDLDDVVFAPVTTYESFVGAPEGYAEIEIEAPSSAMLETVRSEATAIMRRSHRLGDDAPLDFRTSSPIDAVRAAEAASTVIRGLLAALAIVSLIVGGIGIMNIQLVSVAERTMEIGIRGAIGASPEQIRAQFVVESIVLSTVGALLGALLGLGSALAGAKLLHWSRVIDASQVLGAMAFGIVVGVAFGYLPAKRASELDPIDALRKE